MKTKNELIAEFMGYVQWTPENTLAWYEGSYLPYTTDEPLLTKEEYYSQYMWSEDAKSYQPTNKNDLAYHRSWNELMPVIGKISETKPMNQSWYDVKYRLINADIEGTYNAVVNFINWYNNQVKY